MRFLRSSVHTPLESPLLAISGHEPASERGLLSALKRTSALRVMRRGGVTDRCSELAGPAHDPIGADAISAVQYDPCAPKVEKHALAWSFVGRIEAGVGRRRPAPR